MNEALHNIPQESSEHYHSNSEFTPERLASLVNETRELHQEWDVIVSTDFPRWDAPESELPTTDAGWQALEQKQDRLQAIGRRLVKLEHDTLQILTRRST
jgi:hypothetical protein